MHAEAIQFIQEIEKRCDTSQLTYRGVSYWPLCRLRLWSALLQRTVLAKKEGSVAMTNAGRTWPEVSELDGEMTLAGSQALGLLRYQARGAPVPPQAPTLQPNALFFVRPEEYGDTVNGAAYAKILDSVYDQAQTLGPALKIENANAQTMAFARHFPSLFLHLEYAGQSVLFDPLGELDNIDLFLAAVHALDPSLSIDIEAMKVDMTKVMMRGRVFEKTLRMLAPRALFLSVHYEPTGMAWMLACRWAGVKSIDLQHGRLGPYHAAYTQLTAAPTDGYAVLPDYVWTWGQQTKHDIDVDKNPACAKHGGVVGGNAWLHKWRYGDTTGFEPPEAQTFARTHADKRKILVSLQPLEGPITAPLLEAMRGSPPDWLWLLRLHPMRRHTAPELMAILRSAGITNAEVESATALPLFTLLKMVDHHVTVFSSVVVEAAYFNVWSSILGPEGRDIFAKQIAQGSSRYTPTAADIVQHIRDSIAAPRAPIADDFIDMRPSVVRDALDELLKAPS